MQPSLQLTTAYIDPAFTFRSSNVNEMYSVIFDGLWDLSYDVGVQPMWYRKGLIRNNTVSNALQIDIRLPTYVTMNMNSSFILESTAVIEFKVYLNDADIRQKILTGIRSFAEPISITVQPVGVVGPVYVRSDLDPLVV